MSKIEDIKSPCCKSAWYQKGRADYRCKACDKDITMHIVYIAEIIYEELLEEK